MSNQWLLSFDANFSSFSLAESPPRHLQKLPTNNSLLMRNVIQLCLAANNILFMRKRKHAWYVIAWKKADRFASRRYSLKNKLGDRMIKQLLNSVITKYRDLPVSRTSIICLSLRLRQIIDVLTTDKSRYFAQPRPITVNYCCLFQVFRLWWTA